MIDPRLEKLADIVVNYSTAVKPGDWVRIRGDYLVATPFFHLLFEKVLEAGGNPTLEIQSNEINEIMFTKANNEQLEWIAPTIPPLVKQADVSILILATSNTRSLTKIDHEKEAAFYAARSELQARYLERSAAGEMRWIALQYPCHAFAQEADMCLDDYEDFVFKATFADTEDPVDEWQRVRDRQEEIIEWLKGKKQVQIKGPNCELYLKIAGRSFVNCSGTNNLPGGEIFTGPVEDSAHGWVEFSYPDVSSGREISGIRLEFIDGKVIGASAKKNEALLLSKLETDPGARYLGELGIGTNYHIPQFSKNMLFDEKLGGTFHLALGFGYPETGSLNKSAIHWDLLCDISQESRILVDDELFYENGDFVI